MSDTETQTTPIEADETITDQASAAAPGAAEATMEAAEQSPATDTEAAAAEPGKPAQRPRRNTPRRPVSQAVVHMNVELRSRHAQQVFRRTYSVAARASYTLAVMLRIYATDTEADAAGQIADDMLSNIRDELTAEIQRMEIIAGENGIKDGGVQYTVPDTFDAEVTSPRASQFLGLIRSLDRFIGLMDLLWLSGVYTDAQYHAGCYQWQRRITKLANRMRNLAQRSMSLAIRDKDDSKRRLAAELLGHAVDEKDPHDPGEARDDDEGEGDTADEAETTETPATRRKRTTKAAQAGEPGADEAESTEDA